MSFCPEARSGRSTRFWCMRIARSTSPRRRNSPPSAKCSSMVWGSTLTTSMKASIALSGCSFIRKLRPLKYDRGSARDSDSSCLMSMRAANQPSAKNSGSTSSHQYSISMPHHQPHFFSPQRHREHGEIRVPPATSAFVKRTVIIRLLQPSASTPLHRSLCGLCASVVDLAQLALERGDFPAQLEHLPQPGGEAQRDSGAEGDQQHEDERRLP